MLFMQVNFKLVFFFWLQSIMFSQYLNFYVFLINLFTVLMFLSAFNAHKDLILVSFKNNLLLWPIWPFNKDFMVKCTSKFKSISDEIDPDSAAKLALGVGIAGCTCYILYCLFTPIPIPSSPVAKAAKDSKAKDPVDGYDSDSSNSSEVSNLPDLTPPSPDQSVDGYDSEVSNLPDLTPDLPDQSFWEYLLSWFI